MPHPVDAREELISLVTAALRAAEVDAKTGKLIFRDEWRPTPRTMPPSAGAHQDPFWWDPILARWGVQPQQDQPLPPASTSTSGGARPDVGRGAGRADAQEEVLQARTQQDVEGAVAELLKRNHGVFDKIISHSFPRKLGDGTASLDGFRYYMIQDMKYLEACAQLKMIAAGNAHDFEEVRAFDARHKKSLQYVDNLKTICITKLGIPASIIEATPRSDELKTSERFYKVALQDRHEDALFGYYVVLLPCVLSYWKIAHRLMHATSTVKNVVYHTAWTEENDDDSSVVKYTKFINENIAAKGGVDQWNYIFNIACMLEAQLFDTGLQHHTLFRIIPDGTYFIHNSSRERVVLAIQKVEGSLQSPFHGSSVVGVDKTGGDNEKWLVDATKNGYMFQNLGTRLYLGVSSEEGRILQAVSEPYYWWINPVPSQPNQGSPLYRIHDSANLRYTLCADNKVLNSLGSARLPINLHDSESEKSPSAVSCQTWSYDRLEQLATHTPDPVSMSFVDDKFSSSKRSSERASSDHSSESDYQAKYKELEQKERESRRQYEQQLAEKDRRLQDMKSRQQAIAQEEWKAREALNLEVQRLKSELHRTEETKRHLEEKANEKEREFHRQYEQQLAEKDRRLQDMESRQQATAQEERKAREALNLEVQRLKSKLHGTEETKRHSKEKANEKERELRRRLMFESTVRPDGVE